MQRGTHALSCLLAVSMLISGASLLRADEGPSAHQIGDTVDALKKALSKGGTAEQIEAIQAAQAVVAPEVIQALTPALDSDAAVVKKAAIEALGRMQHPDAVLALHRVYQKDAKARADEDVFVALLTAIGRLGDESSVAVLTDKPLRDFSVAAGRARVYALGNIRSDASVKALIESMRLASGSARRGRGVAEFPLMPHMQAALTVLTGTDEGPTKAPWQTWWREYGADFRVEPEMLPVPSYIKERWEAFWGETYPVSGPTDRFPSYAFVLEPSDEQVKAAVADMEAARKSGDAAAKLASIYKNMLIVHPKVIKQIPKTARKSGRSVITAAIEALAWMPHEAALKELHRIYRKYKDLYKFEDYYAPMLKAIGRHGDPSSVKILSDKPFKGLTIASGRARILGLSRIRTNASVEALMSAMLKGGGDARGVRRAGSGQPFMGAVRVALAILTGEDHGESKELWQSWWRANRRTFKVSPERPPIPKSMQEAWEEYWEEPYRPAK